MRFSLSVILCLLSIALVVPPAAAVDREKARAHYDQGEKYYRLGEFENALGEYKKVLEYVDSAEMYYNIGQCHRMLKEYEKALFFYRRYLSHVPNAPNKLLVEKHIAVMTQELEAQKKAQQDQVVLPGPGKVIVMVQPPGSLVWVDTFDGRHVGTTPTVLDLEPGPHVLLVKKDGFFKKTFPVTVKSRELHTIESQLETDPDAIAAVAPPPPEKGANSRSLWWWSGVTGTVLFGVGTGVFGYLAWSKNQDWKDTWDEQAREDGRLYGNLATGLAIATVGFAAVTIWTTLFSGPDSPDREKKPGHRAWLLSPSCSTSACGLSLFLEF
ncbi:tetratricopeptide repeat protein [Myxococcota bacterium]|nr:tetratricopeptide repeat protein [Myxococcota bacterium]MBU1412804.1 tetratricopeptide repeat protein [Myxococcota bacterium]MBU1509047.1 tetratricopeptide repeat protein [Myxococcota bacterium]